MSNSLSIPQVDRHGDRQYSGFFEDSFNLVALLSDAIEITIWHRDACIGWWSCPQSSEIYMAVAVKTAIDRTKISDSD